MSHSPPSGSPTGVIKAQSLSCLGGVVHGFFDRRGGDSIAKALELSGLSTIHTLKQVHGSTVVAVEDHLARAVEDIEGDGLLCASPNRGVGVYTADCAPVLLASRRHSAVAAVHAGWRGTLAGICGMALARLCEGYGTEPRDVVAVIGPAIGGCCYEVGGEVAKLFVDKYGWGGFIQEVLGGKFALDLRELTRGELARSGVGEIEILDQCTQCNPLFYSYRREGRTVGSQLSFIGIL